MITEKSRHILTVITVAPAIFMTNLDTSIVNIALPAFTKMFQADPGEVSRVVLIYLLAMVSLLLVFGKLSDRFGAERMFELGYAVFTLASALCAASPSLHALVAFRFVQGVGAAMLLATWGAVTVRRLPAEMHGRAFGIVTVFGGAGMAVGAPIGGLLIQHLSWQWIFLVNIPVGIAAIVLIRVLFARPSPAGAAPVRFDFAGSALSFAGMLLLLLVLNTGPDYGWLSWNSILLFLGAVTCLAAFYRQERRAESPILDFSILRDRRVVAAYGATALVTMILIGFNFIFPFFFDFVRHLDPETTGMLLMSFPIVTILVSPISGIMCDRGSPRAVNLCAVGFLITATLLFTVIGAATSLYFVVFAFLLFGVGLALFFTANTALVMSHADPHAAGMFTALQGTVSYLGAALGVNLFEMIFSFRFPAGDAAPSMDALPSALLTEGFLHATVFGIGLAALALLATLIAREKPAPIQPS